MPDPPIFDLNSFIALQKQYASDLSGIASTSSNEANTRAINDLGIKLSELDNALNESNVDTNKLILQQQVVNRILSTEDARLDSKRANIDNAISGQKRLMQLNDTYRKRYSAYIRIILIVVFALILIIALIFMKKFLPFIPEFLYTLLYIIILSGTFIFTWLMISDIQKRDKFDYDRRDRPAPATPDELKKNAEKAAKAGDLLASVDAALGCRSEGCCATGTTYDATSNKCKAAATAATAFTTLNQAYSQEPELRKPVEPYTPNEFEGYSKL